MLCYPDADKAPDLGHIGQICLEIAATDEDWSFFKADHKAAYKNLPLSPTDAQYCIVALRSPMDRKWYGFVPRTLLFGAVAAVLRYNCLSRIIDVLANLLLGLPVVNYFDDYGCPLRTSISARGLGVFSDFPNTLGNWLKGDKTDLGRQLVFLGLQGNFPGPETDALLRVKLPGDKKNYCSDRIEDFLHAGSVTHKELESLVGRLSYSQTSIFGRFGRAMMHPLYRKLRSGYYQPKLSGVDTSILQRWKEILIATRPRIVRKRRNTPHNILYTDAETGARVIAAVLFGRDEFTRTGTIEACRGITVSGERVKILPPKCLIYGLGMLAIVHAAVDHSSPIDGQCVTLYIDNNGSK